MHIGKLALGPSGIHSGSITHHDVPIALNLHKTGKPSGPRHEFRVDGERTEPPSFAYADPAPARTLRGRLSLNCGSTTLYLLLTPTNDGGYALDWQRPRANSPSAEGHKRSEPAR